MTKSTKHLHVNADLVNRISRFAEERAKIETLIEVRAPELIERLCKSMSLRSIAQRCKLSPTYVCAVRNRKVVASKEAFVKLVGCELRAG